MDIESLLKSSDFLTFWRLASPIGAGIFAIFGLTREFKDGITSRLTTSGKISIAGIAISSLLGLFASVAEKNNELDADARAEIQLNEIRRGITTIDDPTATISVSVECTQVDDKWSWIEEICGMQPSNFADMRSRDVESDQDKLKAIFRRNLSDREDMEGVELGVTFKKVDATMLDYTMEMSFQLRTNTRGFQIFGFRGDDDVSILIQDGEPKITRTLDSFISWLDFANTIAEVDCVSDSDRLREFCGIAKFEDFRLADRSGRVLDIKMSDCKKRPPDADGDALNSMSYQCAVSWKR